MDTTGDSEPAAKRRRRTAVETKRSTHKVTNGEFTHNRANHPLCPEFQNGTCGALKNGWCPVHSWTVHQCARCFSDQHGAHHPVECTRTPQEPKKGTGKGKGKKGGKGKK